MKFAVLGGGNGAHAMTADLSMAGHEVSMFELPQFKENIAVAQILGGIELIVRDTSGREFVAAAGGRSGFANLSGWLYSVPPVQLNARGLGEVTIALGTGFAIPAVGYMTTLGFIDWTFLLFSAPLVVYGFILSLSLEMPDLEVDREFGKMNFVVLMGRRLTAFLIPILTIIATAFFILVVVTISNNLWMLPIFSLVPMVAGLKGYFIRSEGQAKADHNSTLHISSLFFVLIALDSYLLLHLLL